MYAVKLAKYVPYDLTIFGSISEGYDRQTETAASMDEMTELRKSFPLTFRANKMGLEGL